MLVKLDPSDQVPLYEQVAAQIRRAVGSGQLRPGDRLPSAKEMATDIGVNLHTVLRAYGLLRGEGLLELRPYRGAVVAQGAAKTASLLQEARKFVDMAKRQGLSKKEILDLIGDEL